MIYKAITLPYSYDALEPYIDKLTVETHYEKHLKTYVNNTNKLFEGYESFTDDKTIEEILSDTNKIPVEIRQGIINQGGGVANHNFYFSILTPNAKNSPTGRLLNEIEREFGSFENMKKKLIIASNGLFGSGYGWLVFDNNGILKIMSTANQNSPLSKGYKPLIAIDVWEHAYYLKYKNLRGEYVNNIWNLFDWNKIEEIYNSNRN